MKQKNIRFTKMHALGNDVVVINNRDQSIDLSTLPIHHLAHRHMGIGFDQLLVIEPAKRGDFFCHIFNADGSEAEQCGNGLRCVARFLHEENLHTNTTIRLETKAGVFPLSIQDYDHIRLTLDSPHIEKKLVDLTLNQDCSIPISILSLGNPHAIVKVDAIDLILPHQLGPAIAAHPYFPQGVNVGFMQILNRHHLKLRTFERGVGETYACGSNACAAVSAGIANGWLQHHVKVEFRYGFLTVEWEGEGKPLYMIGPATPIFSGIITLK